MKVRISAAYATASLPIEMRSVEIEIDGVIYQISEHDKRLKIKAPEECIAVPLDKFTMIVGVLD
jgi:hypothetical protein